MSEYLTREEFGMPLFNTVKCIGSILTLTELRAGALRRQDAVKVKDLDKRLADQQRHLTTLLPTLEEKDVAEILDRYPWVAKC